MQNDLPAPRNRSASQDRTDRLPKLLQGAASQNWMEPRDASPMLVMLRNDLPSGAQTACTATVVLSEILTASSTGVPVPASQTQAQARPRSVALRVVFGRGSSGSRPGNRGGLLPSPGSLPSFLFISSICLAKASFTLGSRSGNLSRSGNFRSSFGIGAFGTFFSGGGSAAAWAAKPIVRMRVPSGEKQADRTGRGCSSTRSLPS